MSYLATSRPPYNDDDLNSEEEEEERLLSSQHGEASDDGPKRKRSATTTYSEADAAAAKEFEEKIKVKKSRPALTPAELKGSKGLIVIRRSFPDQIKYREKKPIIGTGSKSSTVAQKMNTQSQINSAASYSRTLMAAYKNFARQLFPSLAPEDVLLKIQDFGSKKEIKDYLQLMRNDVRKEYLEGIYGTDKTERILHELENGVSLSKREVFVEDQEEVRPVSRRMGEAVFDEEVVGGSIKRDAAVSNPYGEKNNATEEEVPRDVGTDVSDEEEELELVDDKNASGVRDDENDQEELEFVADKNSDDNDAQEEKEKEVTSMAKLSEFIAAATDQDEEEELEFVIDRNKEVAQDEKEDCVSTVAKMSEIAAAATDDGEEMESNEADGRDREGSDTVEDADMHDVTAIKEDANAAQETFDDMDTKESALNRSEAGFVESGGRTTFAETQETLTLIASQFGEDDFADETGDVAVDEHATEDVKSKTQDNTLVESPFENTAAERFSQFETEYYEDTADERFSQTNMANVESNFHIEEQSQETVIGESMNLGQETQGEASQEY
eukprot:scaffold1252_cov66-Cyclotella_meneghiniana.AAC.2